MDNSNPMMFTKKKDSIIENDNIYVHVAVGI